MRPISGMRPPVANLILAAERLNDIDEIYNYVIGIASYYVSEVKTTKEIIDQFQSDIELMIQQYRYAERFSGNDEDYNKQMETYGLPHNPINKKFEKTMKTISIAIELIIREAANQKVFLEIETLEELGLRHIKSDIIKSEPYTLMDSAITQYKIHGYIKPVPEWTDKVRLCFQKRTHFEELYTKSVGCTPYEFADNYFNLPMDNKFLRDFNKFKALYDYFINPSNDAPSYNDFKPSGEAIGLRQFRNIMNDARDRILRKQA